MKLLQTLNIVKRYAVFKGIEVITDYKIPAGNANVGNSVTKLQAKLPLRCRIVVRKCRRMSAARSGAT